jgi:hypothetical protein
MDTADIIKQICSETGLDFTGKESMDLVPLKDLNIHKTEVWSLAITDAPENHFFKMNKQYRNKIGYRFKFKIAGTDHGLELCKGLSLALGVEAVKIPLPQQPDSNTELYLAVHIHPEFIFTPKHNKTSAPTQALKMCFV